MKVGITTATGRLGRTIINSAIKTLGKENIVGIARTPSKGGDLDIEIRKGDYDHEKDFAKAFRGIDTALIISANGDPAHRISQHRNVIEGAKSAGVRKLVYTSIFGKNRATSFDPIIRSNRQTEEDIQSSGLDWAIGRNGLYIDADLEAIPDYIESGQIINCAARGKCGYTSREELAAAYIRLIEDDSLKGKTYNLCGDPVTQDDLARAINEVYGSHITYSSLSVEEYLENRRKVHDEFMANVITGIYQGIREGAFDLPSSFQSVTGREHLTLSQIIKKYKGVS